MNILWKCVYRAKKAMVRTKDSRKGPKEEKKAKKIKLKITRTLRKPI